MKKKYCVPVIFKGQDNFVVLADSPEEARDKAEQAFKGGLPPTVCGNEWQEFEQTGIPEELSDGQ